MHLKSLSINPEKFPTRDCYPFTIAAFQNTVRIPFGHPVTFLAGENGTGKSTVLTALARKCDIHIWKYGEKYQLSHSRYADEFHRSLEVEWYNGYVPGAFFASEVFRDFAEILDEWVQVDPDMLKYFGGESLVQKSHGQGNMAYFENRFQKKGLYLLDEPESALAPQKQLALLKLMHRMGEAGHAQFIVATHSPILLALPGAEIYSLDHVPVRKVAYEETNCYRIYKDFMDDRRKFFEDLS